MYTIMAYPTILYPIKALSSIFLLVMYPRFMSLFFSVSVPKSCIRNWHTKLRCTQGSKLYFPNGCALKINIIAGIPSGSVHKIYIILVYPAVVYTGSDIGLVYPVVVHTRSASVANNSKFFTAYPISHYPR